MIALGNMAEKNDFEAIRDWAEKNFEWHNTVPKKSLVPLLKAVGGHVANLYTDAVQRSLAFTSPFEAKLCP